MSDTGRESRKRAKSAAVARGHSIARPAGGRVVGPKAKTLPLERRSPKQIYGATPLHRIDLVRRGVPADFVAELSASMRLPKERVYQRIGLARATVDRKLRNSANLSADESERVVGLAQLIGQAQTIVEESGNPSGFDAARWVGEWLERPHPVLGGRVPGELMDTAEGRALVARLLAQQQSSAYG